MTLSAYRHRRRGIRLIHGDCLDVLPRLRCRADLLICDPPYGTTNWAWDVAGLWPPIARASRAAHTASRASLVRLR